MIAKYFLRLSAAAMVLAAWTVGAYGGEPRRLSGIQDSGFLIVGVDIPYGVMEFYDDTGQPVGIDIDIAHAIARHLDVEARFEVMAFDDLFGALHDGTVDIVLSAVTITPKRQRSLLFSAPYLSASTVLAIAKENNAVQEEADLAGKSLGVLKGTLGETLAMEAPRLSGMSPVVYSDNDARIEDLIAGRIDAALVHFLVRTDLPVRIIGDPIRQNFYGAVTNLASTDLMSQVDLVLRKMKRDGALSEIENRYLK